MDIDLLYKVLLLINAVFLTLTLLMHIRNLAFTIPRAFGIQTFRSIFYLISTFGILVSMILIFIKFHFITDFPRQEAIKQVGWWYLFLLLVRDYIITIVMLIVAETVRLFTLYYSDREPGFRFQFDIEQDSRGDYQITDESVERKRR